MSISGMNVPAVSKAYEVARARIVERRGSSSATWWPATPGVIADAGGSSAQEDSQRIATSPEEADAQ